jgi:hypothetical protein
VRCNIENVGREVPVRIEDRFWLLDYAIIYILNNN